IGATRKNGKFCIGLPEGTDANRCRFAVQVGDSASHTLTRALVFSTDEPVDIDFRSEATARVILASIPPAGLCDFSSDEIRNIYDAVASAPGSALGADADEINAVATSLAAQDPGVQAALTAAIHPPPTSTPTPRPPVPTATRANTATPQDTATAGEATATAELT